jgi:Flp pilus assembly protein TadD
MIGGDLSFWSPLMHRHSSSRPRPMRAVALAMVFAVSALSLAACQKKPTALSAADPIETASISGTGAPSFKQTGKLASVWNADTSNVNAAIAYSDALGSIGQRGTQLEVLKTTASRNAGRPDALARLGKKFLAIGEGVEAVNLLEQAAEAKPNDWQTLSALGTAYDQQTRHADAREKYMAALSLTPGEPTVTNNLAMSLALQGKLEEAERLLREAVDNPKSKAHPRLRQNLALVVGLQGRFEESQAIASQDLPPEQVQANLAYLQKMLSRPNTWAELQGG